jgi:polysulfide reductase chain C
MAQGFNTELKCQQEWGWLLTIWLFLGGSGSGLFLLFGIFDLPPFLALVSLGLVLLGGVVLLSELGSPLRAWRGFFRLRTSWLSRGVLFVACFIVSGFLATAPDFASFAWLPWSSASVLGRILGWIAGLSALMITLYPGFFLAANRAIPFWNTPILPVIFFTYAVMGASGIVLLAAPFLKDGVGQVVSLAAVPIIVNLVMVPVYLLVMDRSGGAAKESVRLLARAPLGWIFWIGVVAVGLVLPLPAILWFHQALVPAGAGILIGGLLFRYSVLKAGVYVPSALVAGGVDLSRLNRTGDDLAREYAGIAGGGADGGG